MKHVMLTALVSGAFMLSGCGSLGGADVSRAVSGAANAERNSIREVMLTVADPDEAVAYFTTEVSNAPSDLEAKRGLARSLTRARRHAEAVLAWDRITDDKRAVDEDRVSHAGALVRTSDWDGAKRILNTIPPSHETFARYRLEAMVADSQRNWAKADSFYQTARGLTTTPASLLNNWGYSKLSRGDAAAAEPMFIEAITHNPQLFTSKNNLVLARAARGVYTLPSIPMSQEERARLMHTAGLAAIKRGQEDVGRKLLEDAIATHPRHFDAARRALDAL